MAGFTKRKNFRKMRRNRRRTMKGGNEQYKCGNVKNGEPVDKLVKAKCLRAKLLFNEFLYDLSRQGILVTNKGIFDAMKKAMATQIILSESPSEQVSITKVMAEIAESSDNLQNIIANNISDYDDTVKEQIKSHVNELLNKNLRIQNIINNTLNIEAIKTSLNKYGSDLPSIRKTLAEDPNDNQKRNDRLKKLTEKITINGNENIDKFQDEVNDEKEKVLFNLQSLQQNLTKEEVDELVALEQELIKPNTKGGARRRRGRGRRSSGRRPAGRRDRRSAGRGTRRVTRRRSRSRSRSSRR